MHKTTFTYVHSHKHQGGVKQLCPSLHSFWYMYGWMCIMQCVCMYVCACVCAVEIHTQDYIYICTFTQRSPFSMLLPMLSERLRSNAAVPETLRPAAPDRESRHLRQDRHGSARSSSYHPITWHIEIAVVAKRYLNLNKWEKSTHGLLSAQSVRCEYMIFW